MGLMDRIFGRSPTEKPKLSTEEQAAFAETQALIRRVSGADNQPSALPSQEEKTSPFADPSKVLPRGDVLASTPVSTVGIGEQKINAETLEQNLQHPVFNDPLLPQVAHVQSDDPSRYGAGFVPAPKTSYTASPISERGLDDLRTTPRFLEATLQDPGLSSGVVLGGDDYAKRRSAARLAPKSNTAPGITAESLRALEGVEIEKSNKKVERDNEWRDAVITSHTTGSVVLQTNDPRLETPQEVATRLRSVPAGGGVNEIFNGRPPAMPSEDALWEAARQAAQRADEWVAQQRALALTSKREFLPVAQEKRAEFEGLRNEMLLKITGLKAKIEIEEDNDTRDLMQEVLERSILRYLKLFVGI